MRFTFRTKLLASYVGLILVMVWTVRAETLGSLQVRLIFGTLMALAVAIPLSVYLSRAFTKPLGTMHEQTQRLAQDLRDKIGALTEDRDRFDTMLAGMVEGVLVVSADGRVVIANRSAEKILETTDPLKDRTVAEAIRHPGARETLDRAIQHGVPAECRLEPLGLHARAVALNVQPLVGGGAVAVLHDVTALRRLETIRRDFVSNVSHELQTPVASIQSHAETLLDGALSDPVASRKFVDTIHRNATRMGRLVKDLLKLADLETRSPDQLIRETVDVKDIVEHVVATIRHGSGQNKPEIDSDVPEHLRALGDPDGMAQMLLNLIDNALKYGSPSGRVSVKARQVGRQIEIAVQDDGPGIESRHLSRIFERFYRIDEGRSRERGGTGLGLAIVKHLAESMGGSVGVRSELGRGSCFEVRIPAAPESLPS